MIKDMIVEKEQKIVSALCHVGLSRAEAQILIFLFKAGKVTAREIEETTRLRQPEVSHGTSALINRKWIKTSKIHTEGKGRPYYKYDLAILKKKILDDIQEDIWKRVKQEHEYLSSVRELLL